MMTTSLIIVSLTVFATMVIIYAVDSLITSFKQRTRKDRTDTMPMDQVPTGMDVNPAHR